MSKPNKKTADLVTQAEAAASVFFRHNPAAAPAQIEHQAFGIAKSLSLSDSDTHWFWDVFSTYITTRRFAKAVQS